MIFEKLTRPLFDPLPLLLGCALIFSGFSAIAETPDYGDLSRRIRQQADSVDRLQEALGRHHIELVEPLYGLARIQLSANRFEEAKASADRALQIVRWTEGLESERQFPYLELIVEIEMALLVRNRGQKVAGIELIERIPGDWRLISVTNGGEKRDAGSLVFDLSLEGNTSAELTYLVNVRL